MLLREEELVKIGEGSSSIIFRIFDEWKREWVAVKLFKEKQKREFEKEFLFLKGLRHPNWIEVYDYGFLNGKPYYTMELLEGGTLREHNVTDTKEFLRRMIGVLDALRYLHRIGYAHGDLKPENILVGARVFKLSDPGAYMRGEVRFTPKYAAPEVLEGRAPTPMSDYFSFGVIIYEKLTGMHPFGDTPKEILKNLRFPPPSLKKQDVNVSSTFDRIVMNLLSYYPEQRCMQYWELRNYLAIEAGLPENVLELQRGRFLNRRAELHYLKAILEEVLSGKARFIELRGEKGTGKSELLMEVEKFAQIKGFETFYLRKFEDYREARRILRRHYSSIIGKEVIYHDVYHLFEHILRFLEFVQEITPFLVIIDPLHEDIPILRELLEYIAGKMESGRITILVANNSNQLEGFEVLNIKPFSFAAFKKVLRYKLPVPPLREKDIRFLYKHTGGNPGKLVFSLSKLIGKDYIAVEKGAWKFKRELHHIDGKIVELSDLEEQIVCLLSILDELPLHYLTELFGEEVVKKSVRRLLGSGFVVLVKGILKRQYFLEIGKEKEKVKRTLERIVPIAMKRRDFFLLYKVLIELGRRKEAFHIAVKLIEREKIAYNNPNRVVELLSPVITAVPPRSIKKVWRLLIDSAYCVLKHKEVDRLIDRAMELYEEDRILLLCYRALLFTKSRKSGEILDILERQLKVEPDEQLRKEILFTLAEVATFLLRKGPEAYIGELNKMDLDDDEKTRIMRLMGYQHYLAGEFQEAYKYYNSALIHAKESRNLREILRNVHNVSRIEIEFFNPKRAEKFARYGLSLSRKTSSINFVYIFTEEIALLYRRLLMPQKILRDVTRSINYLTSRGYEDLAMALKFLLGDALFYVGRLQESLEISDDIRRHSEERVFYERGAALAYTRALHHLGRLKEALEIADRISSLYTEIIRPILLVLYNKFLTLLEMGMYEEASVILNEAKFDPLYLVFLLQWHIFAGDPREAIPLLDEYVEKFPYDSLRFLSILEKAFIGVMIDNPTLYLDDLSKILDILKRRGANYIYSQGLGILGAIYTSLKSWDLALRYFEQCLGDFQRMNAYFMIYRTLPFYAKALYSSGKDRKRALEVIDEWRALKEKMGIIKPLEILRRVSDEIQN